MNLFYHTDFYVLFSIHIISISVCQVISSNYVLSQNRTRHKRVYEGSDVTDDQFPYVVFIKSITSNNDSKILDQAQCQEKLCTGTLIHPRYVLTLLSCVVSSKIEINATIYPHNIHIFLNSRPYNEVKENTTYLVGQQIISKLPEKWNDLKTDNVALIFMNDTFSSVKIFPKVMEVDPVAEGSTISCTTVGYSLIGRNLSQPVNEGIKPSTYNIDVEMNIRFCSDFANQPDAYMCHMGKTPTNHSLCQLGDEGSPLLCKRPVNASQLARQESNETATTNSTDFYVYGLAHVVPKCTGFDMSFANWTSRTKVLFLYMLKYGSWINKELSDYQDTIVSTEPAETTVDQGDQSSTVSSAMLTTTTTLPEYYDTDDYDAVKKNPVRCRPNVYGHLALHGHGPLIAVRHHPYIPPHRSAASRRPPSSAAVLCAVLWYTTVIPVRRLPT